MPPYYAFHAAASVRERGRAWRAWATTGSAQRTQEGDCGAYHLEIAHNGDTPPGGVHTSMHRRQAHSIRVQVRSGAKPVCSPTLHLTALPSYYLNISRGWEDGSSTALDPQHGRAFLRSSMHFVNLTNGVEALPALQRMRLPYSFVRLQSTACEQQNFEQIVLALDSTLLMHLALGA
jgi:hypothetical protein